MTKLQILELLEQHHPNLSSKQVTLYFQLAADRICQETGINKSTFLLGSVAGQRWYNLDEGITKIDKVYFNDVKIPKLIGDPIIDDDEITNPEDTNDTALSTPTSNAENKRFWMFSNYDSSNSNSKTYRIGIVEKITNAITRDGRTSDYQSCSITGTANIRVYAESVSSPFLEDDDATSSTVGPLKNIPAQYHDVLLNGAISRGYKDPKSFNADLLGFFESEFIKGIKAIKRFERTKQSTGFIIPCDF
jgi:hypothetical protein